jgi:hypothetical protein
VIELAEVEERLALFAEGIAGRYHHIKPSSEFTSRRLRLGSEESTLTRDTLYLPERLATADPAAYRVIALQQLCHREFGTFTFNIEAARSQVAALSALPVPDVGVRLSDFQLLFQHFPRPDLASRLLQISDRARVDSLMLNRYPGIHRHFTAYCALLLDDAPPVPVDGLTPLLHALDCHLLGAPGSLLESLDQTARLIPMLETLRRVQGSPADIYQSVAACCELYTLCEDLPQDLAGEMVLPLEEELDSPANWLQREGRLEDWREDLAALEEQMLAVDMLEGEEALAGESENLQDGQVRPEDIHLQTLKNERDTLARRIDMERSAIQDAVGRPLLDARSFRYAEWDYVHRQYLPHWCRLYEERLEGDQNPDLHTLQTVMRRHGPSVQKAFEQIRPQGLQRVHRVADGDELDFNALIAARQDIRAGQTPDERVYSRRDRVHRDVCAAFLVDLSASTDDPIDPPPPVEWDDEEFPNLREPAGRDSGDPWAAATPKEDEPRPRRIIDVQREAMLVMSSALEKLGDSYGIYGFSGYGRDCVEFYVAKEPAEAFTTRTLAAIANMKPKRSTRMGPAIRHAVRKLLQSGNAMKVLLILSDGFPQDSDYGPERGEHEYGVQDTAKALQEAQDKGIETFCVTVDRSGNDYLKRMCPRSRYTIIEEIEDLPEALSMVYQALTR